MAKTLPLGGRLTLRDYPDIKVSAATLRTPATTFTAARDIAATPAKPCERIGVLDVLRGIALLGMFFVHLNDHAIDPGGGFGHAYRRIVELFFSGRFWAMFAILFGAGFGVQLRRADARGDAFIARYLRRLLGLAVFGFIAEGFFGFNVLLGYAIWGVPLLLVRRWTNKTIVIALVLCAATGPLPVVARGTYLTLIGHSEQFKTERHAQDQQDLVAYETYWTTTQSTDYPTVVAARFGYMPIFYSRPTSFLPFNDFSLFLIGLLGLRLGLFEEPRRHRRLITGLMIFGAASWVAAEWLFPLVPLSVGFAQTVPLPIRLAALFSVRSGVFGLLREMWLAFTYIGAILLLVAHNPAWLQRLGAFAITGRMALTNYMLQVIILDLAFSNYAFGAKISAAYAPLAAVALFVIDVVASRWWLSRYRYGPLEWLWRSTTFARWQPFRRVVAAGG